MCIYIHVCVCVSMHVCSQMWVDMCAPIWNGYVHARVLPLLTDLYVYIYIHTASQQINIYIYISHTHIYIYRWKLGAGSTHGSDPWQSYRLHNNCGRARNAEGIGEGWLNLGLSLHQVVDSEGQYWALFSDRGERLAGWGMLPTRPISK